MVRIIENVAQGVIGEFWGECGFSPDGAPGLTCREQGVLRFHGTDYHSGRVSLWRFPGQGRIEVPGVDLDGLSPGPVTDVGHLQGHRLRFDLVGNIREHRLYLES